MSPAGGRRRLPRGVFSIEDQQLTLPDPIALDTNFVVAALAPPEPFLEQPLGCRKAIEPPIRRVSAFPAGSATVAVQAP